MNPTTTEIIIALIMLGVAVLLVAWFLKYKAGASERRMRSMLLQCGVDPELIELGDTLAIIRDVRQRCRKCQSEDVCERWLAGQETGENDFCPNARTFEVLVKSS